MRLPVAALAVLSLAACTGAGEIKMTPLAQFSETYAEARGKFLEAARAAGGRVVEYPHPLRGPSGEPLATDVVLLGPAGATSVLVISSGTHGVEGYGGSAIQTGLLRTGLSGRLPKNVRLVMIHAFNPYGMAWRRRFNEDNVDLNRNFIDFAEPIPHNDEYDGIADLITPSEPTPANLKRCLDELMMRAPKLVLAGREDKKTPPTERECLRKLQSVISRGQYRHPTGLHYGGVKPSWSRLTLERIAAEHLRAARKVVLMDVHTGLGAYGSAECIIDTQVETPEFTRARSWWGRRTTLPDEDAISPPITGSLKAGFFEMFLPGAEVTACSVEFGTLPPLEVFRAMQLENCLHHHSTPGTPEARNAKERLLRAFYPADPNWRQTAWWTANIVVNQALKGMCGGYSSPAPRKPYIGSRR